MDNNNYMADALAGMQESSQESSLKKEEPQVQEVVAEEKVVTDTVAEQTVPGEQPTEQTQATPEVQTSEEPVIDREKLFQEMLVEKTAGKFNNLEELSSMASQPKQTELDERLTEIQKFITSGGSFEDFILTQATNYDSLNDLDLVKEKMLVDNPDMDESDVDFLISRKYKLNDENFDEDEVRLSKIELKREAKLAKESLKDIQNKFRLPEVKQNVSEDIQRQQAEQQALAEQQRQKWVQDVTNSVSELKEVSFQVNDQDFKHVVTEEQRVNINNLNSDLSSYFKKYEKSDGSVDMQHLNSDRYKLEYFDQIMRSAVAQAKATGTESIINDIKNPSVSSQAQTSETKPRTVNDQIQDVLYRNIL
tara:strand:- start:276 stop:1367 length:1092 start_codon:yes stop_codon:yes gene_type:complete